MNDTQRVKIKADVMWAYLNRKNEMSDRYQVDLCNLSDGAVSALESMGLTVNQKDGKGYFITCKSTNPIRAYDANGEVLEGRSYWEWFTGHRTGWLLRLDLEEQEWSFSVPQQVCHHRPRAIRVCRGACRRSHHG